MFWGLRWSRDFFISMKRNGIFKLVYELLKYYIYSSCNQQKQHIKLVLLTCNEILVNCILICCMTLETTTSSEIPAVAEVWDIVHLSFCLIFDIYCSVLLSWIKRKTSFKIVNSHLLKNRNCWSSFVEIKEHTQR